MYHSCLEQRRYHISYSTLSKDAVTWENQIVAFQGTAPGIGTTLLSFATAWSAARTGKQRVAYLSIGSDPRMLWRYLGFKKARLRVRQKHGWTYSAYEPLTGRFIRPDIESADNLLSGLTIMNGEFTGTHWNSGSVEALCSFIRARFDLCVIDLHGVMPLSTAQNIAAGSDGCVNVVTPLLFNQVHDGSMKRIIRASKRSGYSDVLVNQTESRGARSVEDSICLRGEKLNVLRTVPWSREIADQSARGRLLQLLRADDSLGNTAKELLFACLNRS